MSAKDFVRSLYDEAICDHNGIQPEVGGLIKAPCYEILTAKDLGRKSLGIGFTEEAAWEAAAKQIRDAQKAKGEK